MWNAPISILRKDPLDVTLVTQEPLGPKNIELPIFSIEPSDLVGSTTWKCIPNCTQDSPLFSISKFVGFVFSSNSCRQ